jgi:hypothetical protein
MPRAEPKVEEGILVLFAEDVAEQALPVVERLRAEGFEITTEEELWKNAPIGAPALEVAEEAVTKARKVIVIASPALLASGMSTTIMYMAISCRKAMPVIVTEVALPLFLGMLSSADLRLRGERHEREMERLIRCSLKPKKEDEMPQVIRPGNVAPQGPPPAGLTAICPQCGAELRTTDSEPDAVGTVFEDHQTRTPGWNIPCPGCKYEKVFFRRPETPR